MKKLKTALVLLQHIEGRDELVIYVRPDIDSEDGYTFMTFKTSELVSAVYFTIKKAASLRYDYGKDQVKVELQGMASTSMSVSYITEITIK